MTRHTPSDATEVAAIVAWAAAADEPLEIVAGGSKRAYGRPVRGARTLELAALRGVIDYDPSELVLSARAATPMAEIEALLAAQRQILAFEPPDWSGLLGANQGQTKTSQTLGGVIACNLAGPRRVRAGAARDHFLGFAGVNGRGDPWKAGGRVVKNVTGYDLCKLQAGAYGTLSVLTEITVRVLPKPETSCSLVLSGLDDAEAVRTMTAALNTPHEVSAACHLPAQVAARCAFADQGRALTVLRLEGPPPSVTYRAGALVSVFGDAAMLEAAQSSELWAQVADVRTLLGETESVVWRVCPAPSAAAALLARMRGALASAEGFFDWGGGLLWLSLNASEAGADCGAALLRGVLAEQGGHATLLRASDAQRSRVPVFEPQAAALDALARRVKAGFDPKGILNPGRMQEGV